MTPTSFINIDPKVLELLNKILKEVEELKKTVNVIRMAQRGGGHY